MVQPKYPLIAPIDPALDEEDFRKAVNDKIELLRDGLNDAYANAGGGGSEINFESGIVTITGGGGDVTVNLSDITDWTGGYLEMHLSDVAAEYFGDEVVCVIHTSYIALTDGSYTSSELLGIRPSDTQADSFSKAYNQGEFSGFPKSATTTSFVIRDSGTTRYCKWFVWA